MSERYPALGFDPAPGEPEQVRRCARAHARAATELDRLAEDVAGASAASASWRGAAASAFTASLAPVPGQLRTAAASLGAIAGHLGGWASELEQLQGQARALERSAEQALDRLRVAHARAATVATVGSALVPAGLLVVDVAEAQEDLRRTTLRAEELRADWRACGRRLAAAVQRAADAAPVPRSVGQLVWEQRAAISLASDAFAVLSLPALAVPVVGPALSAGLGVVSTAGYGALAVHADGATADVALGAGVLGLGGAAAAAKQVARTTPAVEAGARVTAYAADRVGVALGTLGSALTVQKRMAGPPGPPADDGVTQRRSLHRLLVAPVTGPPSRKRP